MDSNKKSSITCGHLPLTFNDFATLERDDADIKLFQLDLNAFKEDKNELLHFLEPYEINRARRFHFKKDSENFIVCRAVLKVLLAKQTNLHINELRIQKHLNEKPYLENKPDFSFNLSHSGDCAFFAMGNTPLGVDIEYVKETFNYEEILPQILSQKEIDELVTSKSPREMFYKTWTRKEAIVKATGKGIDNDFNKIPTKDGFHFVEASLLGKIKQLQVKSFHFDGEYIGALAYSNDTYSHINISTYNISRSIFG